ncbi:MAG: hypothetical protein ACRDP1_06735 [Nocardioidaceae bacterium]
MRCGFVLPHTAGPFNDSADDIVALEKLGFTSIWFRDWPLGLGGDFADGYDPLVYAGQVGSLLQNAETELGFAAIQLGYRSPQVTAKSLVSIAALTGRRLRVGVGPRGPIDLAQTWRQLYGYLRGTYEPELFARPDGWITPDLLLCSNKPEVWEAVDGHVDGWLCGGLAAKGIDDKARELLDGAEGDTVVVQLSLRVDAGNPDTVERDAQGHLRAGQRKLAELMRRYSVRGVDEIILRPPDHHFTARELAIAVDTVRSAGS